MKAKKPTRRKKKLWSFLEHNGPVFPPKYKRLPKSVKFKYNSREIRLSARAEEVASYFARYLGHKLSKNQLFLSNFFNDWRKAMSGKERKTIQNLRLCDFRQIHSHIYSTSRVSRLSQEEKKRRKRAAELLLQRHGFCLVDDKIERIGNFKIEPPGLFIGRGRHPLMGRVKVRIEPSDVTINCSEDAKAPKAPQGQRWKAVVHDRMVLWLASWTDPLQRAPKYIYLDSSAMLKAQRESDKYEVARQLNRNYSRVASSYMKDLSSESQFRRQCAVAIYFIDKLGLRAGNEKSGDSADTVGCCSLRVEHLKLRTSGSSHYVAFNFLGKDSIRFKREIKVPSRVFQRLREIMEGKPQKAYVFHLLKTATLNKRLQSIMDGLTARVFRTRLASHSFEKLLENTPKTSNLEDKINYYKAINARVALLCNHKRTVHRKSSQAVMVKLERKLREKKMLVQRLQRIIANTDNDRIHKQKMAMKIHNVQESIRSLESKRKLRELCSQVSLNTSKLNYLDPRITVHWCRKYKVPVEKVFGKSILQKFHWALKTKRFKF